MQPDAEGDILIDRHWKRRRLLKRHANSCAQSFHTVAVGQDVLAIQQDRAIDVLAVVKMNMRLNTRRSVDLPQPDGPIKAVTWCS